MRAPRFTVTISIKIIKGIRPFAVTNTSATISLCSILRLRSWPKQSRRKQQFSNTSPHVAVLGATSMGRMHILCTGRLNSLSAVLTNTLRTRPSWLGINALILPIAHAAGGMLSDFSSTNWPIFIGSFSRRHFFLSCSVVKYSCRHLSQKFSNIFFLSLHSTTPWPSPLFVIPNASGNTNGSPTTKCLGASA